MCADRKFTWQLGNKYSIQMQVLATLHSKVCEWTKEFARNEGEKKTKDDTCDWESLSGNGR